MKSNNDFPLCTLCICALMCGVASSVYVIAFMVCFVYFSTGAYLIANFNRLCHSDNSIYWYCVSSLLSQGLLAMLFLISRYRNFIDRCFLFISVYCNRLCCQNALDREKTNTDGRDQEEKEHERDVENSSSMGVPQSERKDGIRKILVPLIVSYAMAVYGVTEIIFKPHCEILKETSIWTFCIVSLVWNVVLFLFCAVTVALKACPSIRPPGLHRCQCY